MTILLTVIHIIVCLFLVVVVLLQSGKAADIAGAFGGMGSQTAFGPRGAATVLSKATTIAASLFMVTSLGLAIVATRTAGTGATVLERQPAPPAQTKQIPLPAEAPKGPPSVSFTPEGGGATQTVPINIPPAPAPGGGQPAPAKPAPAPKK